MPGSFKAAILSLTTVGKIFPLFSEFGLIHIRISGFLQLFTKKGLLQTELGCKQPCCFINVLYISG